MNLLRRGQIIGSMSYSMEVCHVMNSHSPNGQANEAILFYETAVKPVESGLSAWSQFCQEDRILSKDFALEIHREVARAIG